jgi:translocator protein
MQWLVGLLALIAALLTIAIILPFTSTSLTTTKKPSWQPPNGTFSIVWPILYLGLLVSIFFVGASYKTIPTSIFVSLIALFYSQLLLNVFWPLTFRSSQYCSGLALLVIILALSVAYFSLAISNSNWMLIVAAALVIPYILWISYATSLNVWYCQKQPTG